jgi:uncharacterized membrane protein
VNPRLRTGRLEAFSDGVFAIAITILVLELSVPQVTGGELFDAFLAQWPSYLAYLVSFATIGVAWLMHSAMTEYLHGVDTPFIRLNLLLLLLVSFLPFPTALVAQYIDDYEAERVAAMILGINLLLVALVVSTMWRYAVGHHLVRPDAHDEEVQVLTQRLTPSLAVYGAVIVIGYFFPLVAVFGYLLIALALMIPVGLHTAESNGG